MLPPRAENQKSGTIPFYAVCRLAAHYFTSDAAALTVGALEQGNTKVDSEEKMRGVIRTAYQYLADPQKEGSEAFWQSVVGRAFKTWQQASCAPFLGYVSKVSGHNIDCGTFKIAGDTVYVNGVPTLAADAINGRKFEIALSASDSDTRTASSDVSLANKASTGSKTSASSETYADNKRTTGMKAGKSSDTTTSRKIGRDAKADVAATPGHSPSFAAIFTPAGGFFAWNAGKISLAGDIGMPVTDLRPGGWLSGAGDE